MMQAKKPKFTPRLKRALGSAREAAIDSGVNIIDVDHLSLGILSLKSGPVTHILASLDIVPGDFFKFLQEAVIIKSAVSSGTALSEKMNYSGEVKKIFAVACLFSE